MVSNIDMKIENTKLQLEMKNWFNNLSTCKALLWKIIIKYQKLKYNSLGSIGVKFEGVASGK